MKDIHDDFRAANSIETSHEGLKELSRHESEIVRASIIFNKNKPISAVEMLFNDKSEHVREALRMNGYPIDPEISQASELIGKSVILRNVNVSDASFIISLRTNDKKGRYISSTSNDIKEQEKWIESYLSGKGQAYFIITDKMGNKFGTIRMYDQNADSFCWGSWIISDGAPSHYAIESALIMYKFALKLGFKKSHFDVRKGNLSVIKFHERFGAIRVGETENDWLFEISEDSIMKSIKKYNKYIDGNVTIVL